MNQSPNIPDDKVQEKAPAEASAIKNPDSKTAVVPYVRGYVEGDYVGWLRQ